MNLLGHYRKIKRVRSMRLIRQILYPAMVVQVATYSFAPAITCAIALAK